MHIHLDSQIDSLRDQTLLGGDPLAWVAREVEVPVTTSEEPHPNTGILVSGRILPAYESLGHLRHLVIPFAGVPGDHLRFVRARPEVSLYSLHFNAAATAEMAVGLLLAAARKIVPADRELREGRWAGRQAPEIEQFLLAGKTATILGYGEIGRRVGEALRALGMEVLGVRRSPAPEPGVYEVGRMQEALARSHALVVTAPGGESTKGMIGQRELQLMKAPRLVANVGRGSVIQEEALFEACRDGSVAGAGIDVWYQYPRGSDAPCFPSRFPFHELDNVVLSPHRAGGGDDIERLRIEDIARVVKDLIRGIPVRTVDLEAGY